MEIYGRRAKLSIIYKHPDYIISCLICWSSSNGTDTFVLDMALRNSVLVELIKCK